MNRWTAAPALVVALLGLTACTSAVTPTSPVSSTSSASAAADPTPQTPSAATGIPVSTSPAAATSATAAYPAAEVCDYLRGQIPSLTAIGTPVGREANLTANLFGFLGEHGIAPDGAQLDAATTTQCPDVRSQLLTLTELTSLAQL